METIRAEVADTGSGTVWAGTESVLVSPAGDVAAARQAVLRAAEDAVRERGQACRLVIDDMGARHVFVMYPDGSREAIADDLAAGEEPAPVVAAPPVPAEAEQAVLEQPPTAAEFLAQPVVPVDVATLPPRPEMPATPPVEAEQQRAPFTHQQQRAGFTHQQLSAPVEPAPISRRDARASRQTFLQQPQVEQPATKGVRSWGRFIGLRPAPSESERDERSDRRTVSQHWPGPRTIAVVNGKGGAGKTPATTCLSAVFAKEGGSGVLAWDNNQTRGTLGWRTEQGPHESTLLDLLQGAEGLLGTGAQFADLSRYVHHQTADRFDVLRSKPSALASEQRITPEDVALIHAVAAKYYRMIVIDSGNDETDPLWKQMITHADQLVVPVTTREDTRETGALLLEALGDLDERSSRLADDAVVIVSQAEASASAAEVSQTVEQFRPFVREVVTIPYDPALVSGLIQFDALRDATKRAWLRAAAAVGSGL